MRSKKILFIGDSVTDCARSREDGDDFLGNGYVTLLAARIYADCPMQDYTIVNKGVGGDKVVSLFGRWRDDVINQKPDLLSILIGVNDTYGEFTEWRNGVPHEKFRQVYKTLLDEVLEVNPACKLVLCEPFSLHESLSDAKIKIRTPAKAKADLETKQRIVKELSVAYSTLFVPLQDMFNEAQMSAPNAEYFIRDGLHPSIAGHELIARKWLDVVSGAEQEGVV